MDWEGIMDEMRNLEKGPDESPAWKIPINILR